MKTQTRIIVLRVNGDDIAKEYDVPVFDTVAEYVSYMHSESCAVHAINRMVESEIRVMQRQSLIRQLHS